MRKGPLEPRSDDSLDPQDAQDPLDLRELQRDSAFARRLAASLVGGAAAEDVVQEAWHAMLDRPPRHAANLRGYFATLVRRLALRRRRADGRRVARERRVARDERLPASDELVARVEIHGRLVAAVLALEEPLRGTVLLRFFEDLAPAEIARRQGVPVETVRTRLKRALGLLRSEFLQGREAERGDWLGALVALAGGKRPAELSPAHAGALPGAALGLMAVVLVGAGAWRALLALRSDPPAAPDAALAARSVAPGSSAVADTALAAGRALVAQPPSAERSSAPAEPPVPGPAWPRNLRGRVLDPGGLGIAGATVVACEPRLLVYRPVASARTDFAGRYELSLDALERLSWAERASRALHVSVEAPGFQPAFARIRAGAGAVDLEWDWTLEPGRMLVGRLLDEAGQPVGDAQASVRFGPEGHPDTGVWCDSVDAAGVFRVPLAEGQVPLDVQGWSGGRLAGQLAPELVSAAREEHGRLELPPLVLGQGAFVGGWGRYPDGSPASGVSVSAERVVRDAAGRWIPDTDAGVRDGGRASGHCRTGPDGSFRISGLRAGSQRVTLSGTGGAGACIVASGSTDAELVVDGHRILLTVVDEEGRLLEEVPVAFAELGEGTAAARGRIVRTLTSGDPPTAGYRVRPGSSVVIGAYVPGAPPVEERIVVPELPFESAHRLTVRFRPSTAALSVRLAGVEPTLRARVRLLAEHAGIAVGLPRLMDETGRVGDLPAGRWLVEVDPLPAEGESDCYPPVRLAAPLELEPGVTHEVVVEPAPGAPLALAFAVGDEAPARSLLSASDGSLDTWVTWSTGPPAALLLPEGDEERALVLEQVYPGMLWESDGALPAGRWLLRASFPGWLPVEQWLVLDPCRPLAVRVELVRDPGGR